MREAFAVLIAQSEAGLAAAHRLLVLDPLNSMNLGSVFLLRIAAKSKAAGLAKSPSLAREIGCPIAAVRVWRLRVETRRMPTFAGNSTANWRSRPNPGTGGSKMTATKRPFAACGKANVYVSHFTRTVLAPKQ